MWEDLKVALIALLVGVGGLCLTLGDSRRIAADVFDSASYVAAKHHDVTDYKCTNWNLFMWNNCTISYVETETGLTASLSDHRFGRAPSAFPLLLEHRTDPTRLTTDVSQSTAINRALLWIVMVLMSCGFLLVAWQQIAGTPEPTAPSPAPRSSQGTANRGPDPHGHGNAPKAFGRRQV